MNIQILINHYNEDLNVVKRFLDSLATQENVNFEAIIGSDGGKIQIPDELLKQYSFPIAYAYLPHTGVCHTRNILLDRAKTDYIMFCDIDDIFSKSDGLFSLLKKAEETQADLISSPFQEEYLVNKELKYTTLKRDSIHVHGKIFRRQYLLDNNIRFPDELEYSGDMMFMWLAFGLTKKIVWIDNNFYTWKHQPGSVTRRGIPTVSTYDNTLKCYQLLAEDLKKRKNKSLYDNLISKFICTMYIYSHYPTWQYASKEMKISAYEITKECLSAYLPDYKSLTEKERQESFVLMASGLGLKPTEEFYQDILPWCEDIINPTDVLIIGYGIVGHNLAEEIKVLQPAICDKYKKFYRRYDKNRKYSVAFVCVNTPKTEESLCDITEVKNAIMENNADIFVLKSTILPGTVDKLCQETGKKIIFSPEYYGETQHCNNFTFDYTILGGDKESCIKVQQKLQKVYDGRHAFRITDAKTAELVKYMENAYLATKVSFCQQFFNLAEENNVSYEELRELFLLDPRVNPSHTFVYRDQPWWDSKCLNKDVPAIAETFNASFLKSVISFNEEQK